MLDLLHGAISPQLTVCHIGVVVGDGAVGKVSFGDSALRYSYVNDCPCPPPSLDLSFDFIHNKRFSSMFPDPLFGCFVLTSLHRENTFQLVRV
jgi:hypothetical protein